MALYLHSESKRLKVFVYGTLLKDQPNHRRLGNSRFICRATIHGAIYTRMYGGYPYLTTGKDYCDRFDTVVGEIYEVDEDTLARLDQLEGYSPTRPRHANHYQRIVTTATSLNMEPIDIEVMTYEVADTYQLKGTFKIPEGDWVGKLPLLLEMQKTDIIEREAKANAEYLAEIRKQIPAVEDLSDETLLDIAHYFEG